MRVVRLVVSAIVIGLCVVPLHPGSASADPNFTDPTGDVSDPQGDLTTGVVSYHPESLAVAWFTATAVDFYNDPGWLAGTSYFVVHFDVNADQVPDVKVLFANDGSGNLFADVIRESDGAAVCNAAPWGPGYVSIVFPPGCIGATGPVGLYAEMVRDTGGGVQVDRAPNTGMYGPVNVSAQGNPSGGGFEVDAWGGVHRFGVEQQWGSEVANGPYWPGWDIARGIASPTYSSGYVLDGWGGLHGYSADGVSLPLDTTGGQFWPGWDIARGVALLPDGTGGYVLDGWGGLHPFGVGDSPPPPVPTDGPYWPGWDIARGVALLPDGTGGYVLDGWGGLHPFSVPGHTRPPTPTSGPYWHSDIARGVAVSWDHPAGFVLDGWGALHQFDFGATGALDYSGNPYWPGRDIARGVSIAPPSN